MPAPFLSNGVVVFKLTQTGGGSGASFNVVLGATPTGFGYSCEILNSNATPATLWNVQQSVPFPASVITMDATVNPDSAYVSDNYVNTVPQPAWGTKFWYSNSANPLYMLCVGFKVNNGTNELSSNASCGGILDECISYSLQ